MDPTSGRSRGRARGRAVRPAQTLEESQVTVGAVGVTQAAGGNGSQRGSNGSPSEPSNGNNNNNNDDNGVAAVRGRGGFRGIPELITRPANVTDKSGSGGTEVELLCNYFKVLTPTDSVMQRYHVDFEPNVESTQVRRRLVYSTPVMELFGRAFLFDGQSGLRSLARLSATETTVTVTDDSSPVVVRIRHTGEIPWGHMEMMQTYNTQMRRNLHHLGFTLMGRNYYDWKSKQRFTDFRIDICPGWVTAIAQHENDILCVVDSSTKIVRADTALNVLNSARQSGGNWMETAQKELCGAVVMTRYNNRTYKVDDVVFDKNPENTTFERRGRTMSLVDYYREAYDINIQQPRQPLIQCLPSLRDRRAGRTQMLYLVPELCQLTGLTDRMRQDFNLTRKMGEVSRLAPTERVTKLNDFIKLMNRNESVRTDMNRFGLQIGENLVRLRGRLLPCEKIYMHGDTDSSAATFEQKSGDFSKQMRSKKLWAFCRIDKWVIVCGPREAHIVDEFAATLNRVCGPMAISLRQPQREMLADDRTASFVNACNNLPVGCQIVVCIVPNNNKDRYDAIKKVCYCEKPMPCQVVVARTLAKKQMLMSVCTKIGIQVACKLGAEAWSVKIPPKDIMIVGYDTYHDSLTRGASVGGFVCSMNDTLTSWYSRVSYHNNNEEMSGNFTMNLTEGIKRYYTHHRKLPLKVLIYRDGVGEGMISHVFDYELKQIQDALGAMNKDTPIQLAFVIVTKRVNTRFFARAERGVDNPICGTVVDNTVTRRSRYDFYLVSQSVRQGTVTPTMYNIIADTTPFKPQHHQQLAYKLTHLYFNWQGTIRVPAPCQYAHKLAYLTGTSLHREPSTHLCDALFYL